MSDGEHPDWWDEAACRDKPIEIFFPDRHKTGFEAKKICKTCPVQDTCLEWALAHGEEHGIFGGLSPKQRRRLRRERGISAPARGGVPIRAERSTPKPRPRKPDVVHGTLTAVNAGCHCRACEARRNRGGYLRVVGE